MERSLSDSDVKRYIPNVIRYSELAATSVANLRLPLVILYETGPDIGHWTLLHRTADGIEFFDPYGWKPDREFQLIKPEYQQPHYILNLLKELGKTNKLFYNQFPLQEFKKGVNTCGRWVIARNMFGKYSAEAFNSAIQDVLEKTTLVRSDELVLRLVP